jgi:rod shape-determining protein MreD
MSRIDKRNITEKIYRNIPIILLFISILNEIDFNNLGLKYFSFNFSYILIFYYSLKKEEGLGYVLIFTAGLINDVIVGTPMGISSLIYLLLCGFATYLRNITLRPSLIKDWIFFLITLLILNSLSFLILILIFNFEINYLDQIINIIFTFLFYFVFSFIFDFLGNFLFGKYHVR